MPGSEELRRLPSVDAVLKWEPIQDLVGRWGRDAVVGSVREVLEKARGMVLSGQSVPRRSIMVEMVERALRAAMEPSLKPVINATGVILHTNLGRAPLSAEARAAMEGVSKGYSNLEYDLEAGERGSRYHHAQALLCRLTGAESALVVNNNASAMLLILSALAKGMEVVISRGQLVEIGGGFRIPEVMRESGARLVEVGTTNRTYLSDYEKAIGGETVALLRVHHSNFKVIGFAHEVGLEDLVESAHTRGLLAFDDLGSGALLDTARFGLAHEPMAQESLAKGADLVSFSGDKLLGGPQAGIVLGRRELVARLTEHPLARALRVDRVTLAGLQATLLHYLKGEAIEKVPVWQMISQPLERIEEQARKWAKMLKKRGVDAEVIPGSSTVGGGSLPGETLPTYLVAIRTSSPDTLAQWLRTHEPAVVGRIERDRYVIDPRTVLEGEGTTLLEALAESVQ